MKVTTEFHFDAAHRLPGLPETHKCHRLHGHTYRLQVTVEGAVGNDGFVIDFADVKSAVNPLISQLDHYYLNDVIANPTVEVMLEWLWERIKLPGLCELTLFEGISNHATYSGNRQ